MRLLWVTPALPVPPHDGQRLIAYHLLRQLHLQHHLTLVSFGEPHPDEGILARVRELCDAFYLVPPRRRYPAAVERSLGLWDPLPAWVRVCASGAMRAQLETLAQARTFDAVHFATGLLAHYLDAVGPIPAVCAAYDSLTLALEERVRYEPHWSRHVYWQRQASKMRRYEKQWYPCAAQTYVVAPRDAEFLRTLNPRIDAAVIPNGVDLEYFAPRDLAVDPLRVCFSGVMDYPPNEQAVLSFVSEVMPRLWKEQPALQFWIVGHRPTAKVRALAADARVHVTGGVEDLRPFLAQSAVVVCPVRPAGGIKNKALEAMAMGKPLVATRTCAEALTAREGQDWLLADTPAEMTQAVLGLVNDPTRAQRLGQNARAYVERHHRWSETARQVEDLYREAMEQARARNEEPRVTMNAREAMKKR